MSNYTGNNLEKNWKRWRFDYGFPYIRPSPFKKANMFLDQRYHKKIKCGYRKEIKRER